MNEQKPQTVETPAGAASELSTGLAMMTDAQAETLGAVTFAVVHALKEMLPEVGRSVRMELLVPMSLGNSECTEKNCAEWLPATLNISGELLRVDDRFILNDSVRRVFRLFLRAAFEPPFVSGGKFAITEREDGSIFSLNKDRDYARDGHDGSLVAN